MSNDQEFTSQFSRFFSFFINTPNVLKTNSSLFPSPKIPAQSNIDFSPAFALPPSFRSNYPSPKSFHGIINCFYDSAVQLWISTADYPRMIKQTQRHVKSARSGNKMASSVQPIHPSIQPSIHPSIRSSRERAERNSLPVQRFRN